MNIFFLIVLLFGFVGFLFFNTQDDEFFKTDDKIEEKLLKSFEQNKQKKEEKINQSNIALHSPKETFKKDIKQENSNIKKYSIANSRANDNIDYKEQVFIQKDTQNIQPHYPKENNINYPQESDEELNYQVEDKVSSSEITPQFKQWKKIGNIRYNIFVKKKQNSFSPPSVPVFAKVKVDDKKTINVAIPPDKESYIAIKKGDNELEVKEIKEVKKEVVLLPPPQIGD